MWEGCVVICWWIDIFNLLCLPVVSPAHLPCCSRISSALPLRTLKPSRFAWRPSSPSKRSPRYCTPHAGHEDGGSRQDETGCCSSRKSKNIRSRIHPENLRERDLSRQKEAKFHCQKMALGSHHLRQGSLRWCQLKHHQRSQSYGQGWSQCLQDLRSWRQRIRGSQQTHGWHPRPSYHQHRSTHQLPHRYLSP